MKRLLLMSLIFSINMINAASGDASDSDSESASDFFWNADREAYEEAYDTFMAKNPDGGWYPFILTMRATPGSSSTDQPHLVQQAMNRGENQYFDLMEDADSVRQRQPILCLGIHSGPTGRHIAPALCLVRNVENDTYHVELIPWTYNVSEGQRFNRFCAGMEISGEEGTQVMMLDVTNVAYTVPEGCIDAKSAANPFYRNMSKPWYQRLFRLKSDRKKLLADLWKEGGIEIDQEFAEYLLYLGCKSRLGDTLGSARSHGLKSKKDVKGIVWHALLRNRKGKEMKQTAPVAPHCGLRKDDSRVLD